MGNLLSNHNDYPMTVVIATLGGTSLEGTIQALNQGTIVPCEILVCIPVQEAPSAQRLQFPNLKVLVTECRGQVAQRAVGFKNASHDVVMQLDDDLDVDVFCVERLLERLRTSGDKVAVGPVLIEQSTRTPVHRVPERTKLILKIYDWLMNGSDGYVPGKIDKSGSGIGVDPEVEKRDFYEMEWLPGGCVLHYRKNLIVEPFFPFKGKAFCEDLIHSYLLAANGIRLVLEPNALCGLESIPSDGTDIRQFFRGLAADFKARRYFMKISSRKSIRIYFFYIARSLSYLLKRVMRLFAWR